MQDESTNPWWLKYWEKGYEKGYFTNTIAKNEEYESHAYIMLKPIYINKSSIDQSITRGELVERIYKFMLKKALHDHNN